MDKLAHTILVTGSSGLIGTALCNRLGGRFHVIGRYLNVPLGASIVAAPWLLSGAGTAARWNNAAVGVLLIALSIPRGAIRQRYAAWDRLIV